MITCVCVPSTTALSTAVTVTFTPANWNVVQTVKVSGVDDLLSDGTINYSIVTGDVTSTDPLYDAFDGSTIPDVAMQNQDNDNPGVVVNVIDGTTSESGGTAKVQFSLLAQPNNGASVTIPLSISNTAEGTISQTSITITNANWNNSVANEVTITGVDDLLTDGDVTYNLVTGDPTSADPLYDAITAAQVADPLLTNIDNDLPGFTVNPSSLTFSENGGTATFTVKLNAQPLTNVVLDLASTNLLAATVSPASLTFTNANWNVLQTVTLTGVMDANFVSDIANITLTINPSSDTKFLTVASQIVAATVFDVNTVAPAVPDLKASSDSGVSQTDNLTNDNTPEFTGSCTSDDTIKVYIDNVLSGTGVCAGGLYFVTVSVAQLDGSHLASVTATSPSKLESAKSPDLPIIIDTELPVITLVGTTPVSSFINATYTDAGATALDNKDGNLTTSITTTNTVLTNTIGSYQVKYNVKDSAGNAAVEVIRTVNVVPNAPLASTALAATGNNLSADLTWTAPVSNGAPITDYLVEYSLDGITWSTFTHPASTFASIKVTGLASGTTYSFRVSAVNSAGTSAPSNVATATTTNTAPVLSRVGNVISDYLIGDTATGSLVLALDTVNLSDFDGVSHFGGNSGMSVNISAGINASDKLALTNADLNANGLALQVLPNTAAPAGITGTVVSYGTITSFTDSTKGYFEIWGLDTNADSVQDKLYVRALPAIGTFTSISTPAENLGAYKLLIENVRYLSVVNPPVGTREVSFNVNDIQGLASNVVIANVDLVNGQIVLNKTNLTISEGSDGTVGVQLNVMPLGNVAVKIVSPNTVKATVSPATLTFTPANWNIDQTVTLTGVEDPDINNENLQIAFDVDDATSNDPFDPASTKLLTLDILDNDGPGFTINQSGGNTQLPENGSDSFTVILNTQPTNDVILNLSSTDGGAASLSPTTLTFDQNNWNLPQTVSVIGVNDSDTNDENLTVTVSVLTPSLAPEYSSVTTQSIDVKVIDDDFAGIVVNESGGNTIINEGSTDTLNVKLATNPGGNVSLNVISNNPKVTTSPTILTFNATNWNNFQTLTLNAAEDPDTVDENFGITFSIDQSATTDSYDAVTSVTTNGTVIDNDVPGINVEQTNNSTTAIEGASDTLNVKLSTPPTGNVIVNIASSDITKVNSSPTSLTFTTANWNVAQVVTLQTLQDADTNDESITFTFSPDATSSAEYVSVPNKLITMTVVDDDSTIPQVPDMTSSTDLGISNTDNITSSLHPVFSGTCRNGDKVKIYVDNVLNGVTDCLNSAFDIPLNTTPVDGPHNITISLTTPGKVESPQSTALAVTIDTHNPSVTLLGDPEMDVALGTPFTDPGAKAIDGQDGVITPSIVVTGTVNTAVAGTYPVVYKVTDKAGNSTEVTRNVIVAPRIPSQPTGLNGVGGMFNATINWTAPANNGAPITDYKIEYSIDGINWVVFNHPASAATTATVTGLQDGTAYQFRVSALNSVGYSLPSASISATTSIVSVTTPGLIVTQTNGGLSLSEASSDTFTVALKIAPVNPVKINIVSSDTGAGIASPTQLTFTATNWNVAQTVTVSGVNDADLVNENISVTVSVDPTSDSAYLPITSQVYPALIVDDDTAGYSVSQTGISVPEDGGTGNFDVVLTAKPQSDVVFSIALNNGLDATLSKSSLTFTPANWDTPQNVVVTGINDNIIRNDSSTITISVNAAASDNNFDNLADKKVVVTIIDDDVAGLVVTPTGLTMAENGGVQTIQVKLNRQPVKNVVLNVNNSSIDEMSLDKSTLTFSNANWNTPQTVTVNAIDDNFVRDDTGKVTFVIDDNLSDNNFDNIPDFEVPVTFTNDDVPGFTTTPATLNIDEGNGSGMIAIKLNKAPVSPVTLKINSNNSNVTLSTNSLTFNSSNWALPRNVTVTGVENNTTGNTNSLLTVSIDKPTTDDAFDNLANQTVDVTILDNEVPNISIDKTVISFNEKNGTDKYHLKLSSAPTSDVTIKVLTTDVTVSPSTLTFTSANWDTAQEVTLTSIDNNIVDGTRTYVVKHEVTSTDTDYNAKTISDVVVTIADDDIEAVAPVLTQDVDGISTSIEDQAPNNGDGNNDGIKDSAQANVASLPTSEGSYVTLVAEGIGSCPVLENVTASAEADNGDDKPYTYPFGLIHFESKCSNSVTVTMIWHGIDNKDGLAFRKYGPLVPGDSTFTFYDYPVEFGTVDLNGKTLLTTKFTVTDGQKGDQTIVDGLIIDPAGIIKKVAGITDESSSSTTKTTTSKPGSIGDTGSSYILPIAIGLTMLAIGGGVLVLKRKRKLG